MSGAQPINDPNAHTVDELELRNQLFRSIADIIFHGNDFCTLRKCHRDGSCTGPLVESARVVRMLAVPPGKFLIELAGGPFPLCFTGLPESFLRRYGTSWDALVHCLLKYPEQPYYPSKRRIAARRWSKLPDPEKSPDRDQFAGIP